MVEDEGFRRGLTSWDEELLGNLKICRYEFNDEYRKKITSHIVDRFIRFEVDLNNCLNQDNRFSTHYKGIVEGLLTIMDGHLLQ